MLFDNLPQFPPALPDEELAVLRSVTAMPPGEWDLLEWNERPAALRLERRGLLKISRSVGELWAQRTPEASVRPAN